MKKVFLSLILMLLAPLLLAQETITITQCYEWARENYPQIKQYDLIGKTEEYNLSNASKGWLPQLSVNAKATYQSDVTKLPFDTEKISSVIPGFTIPTLSKDQYQVVAELNQTIWDGGIIRSTRELSKAQAKVERGQLESELYVLNERVNQLYFGCLLQDELIKQNTILQHDLIVNIDRIEVMMNNGVANQSDKESLEVELLRAQQQAIELKASREAYRLMLGMLTGKQLSESVNLAVPDYTGNRILSTDIRRPELLALDARESLIEVRNKQIDTGVMPRISLFLQGGYGRPGLNFLEDSFEPFYMAGIRLSWNLGKLYTLNNDRRKTVVEKNYINMQREMFIFNTSLKMMQDNAEINKINDLIKTDNKIIYLRENIKKAAEIKLENGVISVTDLIREIHSEDLAKQTAATHRMQQLMSIYNYIYTTNN